MKRLNFVQVYQDMNIQHDMSINTIMDVKKADGCFGASIAPSFVQLFCHVDYSYLNMITD